MYLKFTNVDAVTGISVGDAPASNGPAYPAINGLEFIFALASEYPTNVPTFYGSAPDGSDLSASGVIGEVTKDELDAAQTAELAAQVLLAQQRWAAIVAGRRYQAEIKGFVWSGFYIDTTRDSQSKINAGWAAAQNGMRDDSDAWKCLDLSTKQVVARPTTNAEMAEIGQGAYRYVQNCYNREAELLAAIADGSITDEMLKDGWPS